MPSLLSDTEKQIVQMLVLDRWNPGRINKKIASHFGLSPNQVRHIRRKPEFQAEYAKQLAIYQHEFEDVELADRKERVRALNDLFFKIPDIRMKLKLKVLEQISREVGHLRYDYVHGYPVESHSVPQQPKEQTYEEWLHETYEIEKSSF